MRGVVGFFVLKVLSVFCGVLTNGCVGVLSLICCHLHLHREDSATPVYPVQLLSAVFVPDFSGFVGP